MTLSDTTLRPTRKPTAISSNGWVHICNGLDPQRDGGMVPSILGLTGALARRGSVRIVTPTPSTLRGIPLPDGLRLVGPERDLKSHVRRAEIVHLHGLWQGHTRRGSRAARRVAAPYLITVHGMAEPWALRHKAFKKHLYMKTVERFNLRHSACLHALTKPEVEHLQAIAPRTPIALIPNGVDLSPFETLPSREELESLHPEIRGKFNLLFLSRLHIKKGLDLLAQAFSSVSNDYPRLHLILAGSDDGAKSSFLEQIASYGLSERVTCLGHVSGNSARTAWGAADAFVLPSYSEGFSMAILEALAARKPSLITTTCHFPELAEIDGAVVVEPDAHSVTRGLRELLERSSSEREQMAGRGRALVESRYTWDQQAKRMAEVYQWVAYGGEEPEAVADAKRIASVSETREA